MVCEEAGEYVYRYLFFLDCVVVVTHYDVDGGYRGIREGLAARPTLF